MLSSGFTPFPKFDQADPCNVFDSFVSKFVALIVPLSVFPCGDAIGNIFFRGVPFDFPEGLVPDASLLDCYPCLFPKVSIDLQTSRFTARISALDVGALCFFIEVSFSSSD